MSVRKTLTRKKSDGKQDDKKAELQYFHFYIEHVVAVLVLYMSLMIPQSKVLSVILPNRAYFMAWLNCG